MGGIVSTRKSTFLRAGTHVFLPKVYRQRCGILPQLASLLRIHAGRPSIYEVIKARAKVRIRVKIRSKTRARIRVKLGLRLGFKFKMKGGKRISLLLSAQNNMQTVS